MAVQAAASAIMLAALPASVLAAALAAALTCSGRGGRVQHEAQEEVRWVCGTTNKGRTHAMRPTLRALCAPCALDVALIEELCEL